MRTIKSRDARARWAELVRDAEYGTGTVIEHYNRPVAKIVPYTDPAQATLEHRLISQARRLAETARTCPTEQTADHRAVLESTESALASVVHHLGPLNEDMNIRAHLAAVRVATREHYLPELMTILPGTWQETDTRWTDALNAVGVDQVRVRRLRALTHAEAVAACEHLGIEPPPAPVGIDARVAAAEPAGDW